MRARHACLGMTSRFEWFLLSAALVGCGDDVQVVPDAPTVQVDAGLDDFTPDEQQALSELTPISTVPADSTNAYAENAKAARLGQMLFFDKSYSGALVVGDDGTNGGLGKVGETGKISCHSCHATGSGTLDDQRVTNHVSLGTNFGTRNALGLVNSSLYKWTNWGGRFDSQWSLPMAVSESPAIMRSTRLQIAHMLYDKYRAEYDAVFPVPLDAALDSTASDAARFPASGKPKAAVGDADGPWELMTQSDRDIVMRIWANYGKALAAYTRTLISGDSPFDRYVAGDKAAISDAAKRGLHTYLAACASCHTGPNLASDEFLAIGVPQTGTGVPASDNGRLQDVPALLSSPFNSNSVLSDDQNTGRLTGLTGDVALKGLFRNRGLRNVATSAPYMHAGQFATLEQVVTFYNEGGGVVPDGVTKDPRVKPLGLSASEQADLVELLRTFTGEPVPVVRLVDISK